MRTAERLFGTVDEVLQRGCLEHSRGVPEHGRNAFTPEPGPEGSYAALDRTGELREIFREGLHVVEDVREGVVDLVRHTCGEHAHARETILLAEHRLQLLRAGLVSHRGLQEGIPVEREARQEYLGGKLFPRETTKSPLVGEGTVSHSGLDLRGGRNGGTVPVRLPRRRVLAWVARHEILLISRAEQRDGLRISRGEPPVGRYQGHQRIGGLLEQDPVPRFARLQRFLDTPARVDVAHGGTKQEQTRIIHDGRLELHPEGLAVSRRNSEL